MTSSPEPDVMNYGKDAIPVVNVFKFRFDVVPVLRSDQISVHPRPGQFCAEDCIPDGASF